MTIKTKQGFEYHCHAKECNHQYRNIYCNVCNYRFLCFSERIMLNLPETIVLGGRDYPSRLEEVKEIFGVDCIDEPLTSRCVKCLEEERVRNRRNLFVQDKG